MAFKRTRKEFEADLQAQQSPYVFYGTPLPPLDPEVRDDGSYVPVWQQEVRDERGRKRLHGAFTGGYSAGYFNTVGSKEGWTPAAFVSSRSNRAKDAKASGPQQQQRPEDFMDEEDLTEAAEAQKIETNANFAGLGTTDQDEQHKGTLMDIFKAQDDTAGVKLLRKMGWRDGQGIGPRVRRKVEDGGGHHSFAPTNPKMVRFDRKDDRKGLGHQGERRLDPEASRTRREDNSDDEEVSARNLIKSRIKPKHGKQKKKSAFGVGVLNDDASDDDDPYSLGPRISYNKTITADKSGSTEKASASTVVKAPSSSVLKSKHVFRSKPQSTAGRPHKCHDGRPPLNGFVLAESLASLSLGKDDKYAPPNVPDGWQPRNLASSDPSAQAEYRSTADIAKASTLDAKGRAAMLGEAQLPGKSVFDFLSPAARDKLAAASKNSDLPPGLGEQLPARVQHQEAGTDVEIPPLDQATAKEALRRGAPASLANADDNKRSRFEHLLQYRAGSRDDPPTPDSKSSSIRWAAELEEFTRFARAFKPMSGLMASRFTSAGVSKPSDDSMKQDLAKRQDKPKDPAEEAALMGMFGPLTRSSQLFYPTHLVCKRFGVREPPHVANEGRNQPTMTATVGSSSSTGKPTTELVSNTALGEMESHVTLPLTAGRRDTAPSRASADITSDGTGKTSERAASSIENAGGSAEVDASRNEALEGERAGEAVFKAIFGDDDDDSD